MRNVLTASEGSQPPFRLNLEMKGKHQVYRKQEFNSNKRGIRNNRVRIKCSKTTKKGAKPREMNISLK